MSNRPMIFVCDCGLEFMVLKQPKAGEGGATYQLEKDVNHTISYVPLEMVLFLANKLAVERNSRGVRTPTVSELFDDVLEYKTVILQALDDMRKDK
jgi:hypothetical protein